LGIRNEIRARGERKALEEKRRKIFLQLVVDLAPVSVLQYFGDPLGPTPYPHIRKRQKVISNSLYFL
jgi:hypothetical protein